MLISEGDNMLTDRHPNNVDNDDYIRQWAIDHLKPRTPITHVPLQSTCADQPCLATIHLCMVDQPG